LLRQLSEETSTLVRQEVQLAKAELSEKAKQAGKGAGLLAGAAVMGVALLGAFTAFLIAVIAQALSVWLAALVVTLVYAVVAVVLALAGRSALRKATPVKPEQTIDTVKEDVQWAKTQAKSAKR
jgi:apolipoprotein N-acyltransferase